MSPHPVQELVEVLKHLRQQCPWDKKQTIDTLRKYTVEELYELLDAIDKKDWNNIKEELGDILVHLIFYANIAEEQKSFDFHQVARDASAKLIQRHPHVYGNTQAATSEQVELNWEKIKLEQKPSATSLLAGVPKGLPAMLKAFRLQEKTARVGFDFPNAKEALQKIDEELNELKTGIVNRDTSEMENELGDFLFSIINMARLLNLDPEKALEKTNAKFMQRFQFIEQQAQKQNKKIDQFSLDEMNLYWEEAKTDLSKPFSTPAP